MPHPLRAPLASRFPVHVTLRTVDGLATLRSRACFGAIDSAFKLARRRQTVRLVEFSVQGNHLQLVVEAADAMRLAPGHAGLGLSIAKRLNALLVAAPKTWLLSVGFRRAPRYRDRKRMRHPLRQRFEARAEPLSGSAWLGPPVRACGRQAGCKRRYTDSARPLACLGRLEPGGARNTVDLPAGSWVE
jgi:hypothetical protein